MQRWPRLAPRSWRCCVSVTPPQAAVSPASAARVPPPPPPAPALQCQWGGGGRGMDGPRAAGRDLDQQDKHARAGYRLSPGARLGCKLPVPHCHWHRLALPQRVTSSAAISASVAHARAGPNALPEGWVLESNTNAVYSRLANGCDFVPSTRKGQKPASREETGWDSCACRWAAWSRHVLTSAVPRQLGAGQGRTRGISNTLGPSRHGVRTLASACVLLLVCPQVSARPGPSACLAYGIWFS